MTVIMKTFSALSVAAALTLGALGLATAPAAAAAESAWSLNCEQTEACRIETAVTTESGRVAARLAIQRGQGDRYVGGIVLPLGIHIPSGVKAVVDDVLRFDATFVACGRGGCQTVFPAEPAVLEAMRKGLNLTVTVVDARTGRQAPLTFSLIGFTAASEALAAR